MNQIRREKLSKQELSSVTTEKFELPPDQAEAFQRALIALNTHLIPYVVEGAFAIHYYCGIWRHTKDLDVFVQEENVPRALAALANFGFQTHTEEPRWLSKAVRNDCCVDIIHGSGNRVAKIDNLWIERGRPAKILGQHTLIASPEDTISFKGFIQERHRYDGADIVHIINGVKGQLEWDYLIERFGDHWPLLLNHLINFFYIYPSHRDYVPRDVFLKLLHRFEDALAEDADHPPVCQGTLISTFSYLADLERGYQDARELVDKENNGIDRRAA